MEAEDQSGRPHGRRAFFVIHHEAHLEILRATIRLVRKAGHPVWVVAVEPRAIKALDAIGRKWIDVEAMEKSARAGDILVLGGDWGPPRLIDVLDRVRNDGVRVIGVIEAPRVAYSGKYLRSDEMLVWGEPSRKAFNVPADVVGSPVVEKGLAKRRPARIKGPILVNYKRAPHEIASPDAAAWLEWVRQACRGNGRLLLSAHPAASGIPTDLTPSDKPVSRLVGKARLLVSRPSMVVMQALAIGTPVILFPLPGEELHEFADPMGSYRIAHSREELATMLAAARRGDLPETSTAFLDHHVSVDPQRSSAQRMADAIVAILKRDRASA